MEQLACGFDTAKFFIFSENVFGPLIYYSHFFSLFLSFGIGIFIFSKDRKSLINQILFFITTIFSLWIIFDLVLWANEKSQLIMFFWSVMILLEILIYASSLYFIDVFVSRKDVSVKKKIGIFILLLPVLILLPTKYTLVGFDATNCFREPVEGFMSIYYAYIVEAIYIIWLMIYSLRKYIKSESNQKKQILLVAIGMFLFLMSFSSGNIIGSITENWTVAQVGVFGMPIFIGFISYMIIKYQTFNIKLLATQALIFSLGFLVVTMAFIRNIENVRIVVIFTFVFVLILGYLLIKSVNKEIKQRERLEVLRVKLEHLNVNLEDANEKLKGLDKLKSEFVSLASHQLRSPLTAIKGYASMLMDGDYGIVNDEAKEATSRIFESSQNLAKIVEDLLNVSKIEQGGMKYEMAPFDLNEVACDMTKDLSITAENKGLKMTFLSEGVKDCIVNGDKDKIRQVVLNFIDNSIKYTKEGEIKVKVEKVKDKIVFSVSDTGMGMTPEIKETLFHKFARGDGARMNTSGTGLGLYLTKEITEAHGGRVYVESEGMGKGSTFFMELNANK